jgi:protein gp37
LEENKMRYTEIEWADESWNPVHGCDPVSPGCDNCYAKRIAEKKAGTHGYPCREPFKVILDRKQLENPPSGKAHRFVFIPSMGDLFHEEVPIDYIEEVFSVIRETPQFTYTVLTKRSERMLEVSNEIDWPFNAWAGVTVENANYINRMDHLRAMDVSLKFVSFEPLLGPIPSMNLDDIGWAIVGGESGHGFRRMNEAWAANIRDQCVRLGIPFYFKQWSGVYPKNRGWELQGMIWNERPEPIVQEPPLFALLEEAA